MPREKEKPGDAPGDARHLPVRKEWHRPAGRIACKFRTKATPSKTPPGKVMRGEGTAAGIQGCIPPGSTPGGKGAFREGKAVRFEQKTWGRRHPSGKKESREYRSRLQPQKQSHRSRATEVEENTCLSGKLVARGGVKGRPKKANHKHKGKVPGPQASFRKTATKQPGREDGRSRNPTAGPRTPRSPAFALFCPPLGRTW